jgi:hypothetical protein
MDRAIGHRDDRAPQGEIEVSGAHGGANRDWVIRRIQGAPSNLGHELARSTIAQILKPHGIERTPERFRATHHWPETSAASFVPHVRAVVDSTANTHWRGDSQANAIRRPESVPDPTLKISMKAGNGAVRRLPMRTPPMVFPVREKHR